MFRVDREQTTDGFVQPGRHHRDLQGSGRFENVETGWMDFPPGCGAVVRADPAGGLAKGGTLPDRPGAKHKNGIRFMLKLNKTCGGDKPVRELAGTSKAFLAGVEEVYERVLRSERAQISRPVAGDRAGVDDAGQVRIRRAVLDQLPADVPDLGLGQAARGSDLPAALDGAGGASEAARHRRPVAQTVPPPNSMKPNKWMTISASWA